MRININLPALGAFTSLNAANKSLSKAIASLSTGLRINSAADDAAGFAMSETMRSQISGLDAALRNSQDGISLLQTAEGALGETNSMLQRMRELAVQASNDTLTSQDRQYLQLEIDELKGQIDRIADTTQFNKKRLLDGSCGAVWSSSDPGVKARIHGGLVSVDEFGQKVNHEGNYRIEVSAEPGQAQVQKSAILKTWKTVVDYGADADPEDVTETVRTTVYDEVVETEERVIETVKTTEEPYIIYINGSEYGNTAPVDNAVNAVNEDEIEAIRDKWMYDSATKTLRIMSNGTFNIVGRTDGSGNSIPTSTRVLVDSGLDDVNVSLTDVNIQYSSGSAMETSGSQVNLYLSGTNTLRSSSGSNGYNEPAGIQCLNVDGCTTKLTISSADGDGENSGSLDVQRAGCGAGIGGSCIFSGSIGSDDGSITGTVGEIVINGGTIKAQGHSDGAGIGSGGCYNAYTNKPNPHVNITINGGDITAISGYNAAGIGSGASGSSRVNTEIVDSITINGGTVNATGDYNAAGIGGGIYCNSGQINISSNATVNVTGWVDTENNNTLSIGRGEFGLIGENDAVIFGDAAPDLRDYIPDKPQIVEQSTIYELQTTEYTRLIPRIEESTRTVRVTPPTSFENETENVTLGSLADELSANGLPAGSYTISTMDEPVTDCLVTLTGSYGFSSDLTKSLTLTAGYGAGLMNLETNANILFEVTGVDRSAGTVTLKATANLMGTDGIVTKHIVRENIILTEENTVALSGLDLMGTGIAFDTEETYPAATLTLASGGAGRFSTGNKFVYNLTASAISDAPKTVEISGTQDSDWELNWGENVTDQPVRYGLDSNAIAGSTLIFSNFYINSEDGTVYEGDIVLTTNSTPIENGADLASFDALRDNPITTTEYLTAEPTTKLSEITGLYNTEGVFMLDQP